MLMFVGDQCGRAAEAVDFYAMTRSGGPGRECLTASPTLPDPRVGDVRRAEFTIGGTPFVAFDNDGPSCLRLHVG